MTNVLANVESIIDTYEKKEYFSSKEPSKLECILQYFKVKKIISEEYSQNLIKEYIVKDKTINSGRATIKGTRVTPEDIGRIMFTKKNTDIKDIIEEYPSLTEQNEVLAGMIYFIDKHLSLITILLAK